MMSSTAQLGRDDFVGRWTVTREIRDFRAGQEGRFAGEAVFESDGASGLTYREEGVLWLGDAAPMRASRCYLWRFDEAGVEVRFEDGRPFHAFVPDGRRRGTDHLCGADLYGVEYDFGGWPAWQAAWRVQGPAKDYAMESRYTCADSGHRARSVNATI